MKKYTITEAKAELRTLKACSDNEIAAFHDCWKMNFIEKLQSTTGRIRETYSKCLDVLEEKFEEVCKPHALR